MRLEQLEYLLVISKSSSINGASEKLHMTHQSLNRAIKTLENELGAVLLKRTAKGISLTEQGEKALKTAELVLDAIECLKQEIQDATPKKPENLKGSLDIAITPVASSIILPEFFSAYNSRYPYVNISLKELSPPNVLSDVLNGHSEIGLVNISSVELAQVETKLNTRILVDDSSVILVNKSHPLAQSKSLSIKSLLNYPFILYGDTASDPHWVFSVMKPYGQLKRYILTNSANLFYENIINGPYISFFSQKHWQAISSIYKNDLVAIPLRKKEERAIFASYVVMVTQPNQSLTPQASALITMLSS